MNILVCGDSYNDFDTRYPGLHWADRLAPHTVYRLARGGASNFSIWHQVQYAIKFRPDLVLVAFTACPRVEIPKLSNRASSETGTTDLQDKQWHYRNTIYNNVDHAIANYNNDMFLKWMPYYIEEYEVLKNFLFIKSALDLLEKQNIQYYFTLGGFASNAGMVDGVDVNFQEYHEHNILPNGYHHSDKLHDPYFHIADETWHADHARLVMSLL